MTFSPFTDRYSFCRTSVKGFNVLFRQMTREDSETIVARWFEDPETRRRLGGMLPFGGFFHFASRRRGRYLWLVYEAYNPVGMVDFDSVVRPTSFAFLVAPEWRGRGLGRRIVEALLARTECPGSSVEVSVEQDNIASLRCLRSAGFTIPDPTPDEDGFLTLVHERTEAFVAGRQFGSG